MKLRGIVYEDFIQWKEPCMFLICPYCSFKCDTENGTHICQNSSIINLPIIELSNEELIRRYMANPIVSSVCLGGLEPMDNFDDIYSFILDFRKVTNDTIVIYTGYNMEEIPDKIEKLKFKNIIIKFGRYIPNRPTKYDGVLGVTLASDNQFAVQF